MTTKFDVGQTVFIKGKVVDIKITKNVVLYSVEYDGCSSTYTATYKENQLVGTVEDSDGVET